MPDLILGVLVGGGLVLLAGGAAAWVTQKLVTGKPISLRKPKIQVINPTNETRAKVEEDRRAKAHVLKELKKFEHKELNPSQQAQLQKVKDEIRRGTRYAGPVMGKSK